MLNLITDVPGLAVGHVGGVRHEDAKDDDRLHGRPIKEGKGRRARRSAVRRDHALAEREAPVEAPLARLDHGIGPFGKVIEGMDVLDDLEKMEVDKKSRPKERVEVKNVTIHANPLAG